MVNIAKWTIMIYANGNNDLEPEMWQAKLATETLWAGRSVNVVLLLGREEPALVRMMRPRQDAHGTDDQWKGVRSYVLTENGWVLLADWGKENMADPCCLYKFVNTMLASFPAERNMLIFGGHGYQFVGSMPDYSQEDPCIMGYPAMVRALERACFEHHSQIDLLIGDVCYFNFVEVIFEFASHADHAVKHVLTYICDGPIRGMPYDRIIRQTQTDSYCLGVRDLIKNMIKEMELDLVAFVLEYNQLAGIKQAFHQLAECYIRHKAEYPAQIHEILFVSDYGCPWFRQAQAALAGLEELIIDYKRSSTNDYGLLNIANVPTENRKAGILYSKLQFTHSNAWTQLLHRNASLHSDVLNSENDWKPIILAPEEIFAYISLMNGKLTRQQKLSILNEVANYKNWF